MGLAFEHGDVVTCSDRTLLKKQLQAVWEQHQLFKPTSQYSNDQLPIDKQPYLSFGDGNITAKNYIGFIQTENDLIEIYPKVFNKLENPENNKVLMLKHVFQWLSYCSSFKFPFARAILGIRDISTFPEMIIYLIAKQMHTVVSSQPMLQYQKNEEAVFTPKGRIDIEKYINNNLIFGNYHKIDCDYEQYQYNNMLNRIIKYCARLLFNKTRIDDSKRLLEEVIFILDEVEDVPCFVTDVDRITLNPFYNDYIDLVTNCRLVLDQQLYSQPENILFQWCLFIPMEQVYEEYIAGIVSEHFKNQWKVDYHKGYLYLSDDPQAFRLEHDILLTSRNDSNNKIIIDAKYKQRDYLSDNIKRGIDEKDVYQMVSYAFKRGCRDVVLVYPNLTKEATGADQYIIKAGYSEKQEIHLKAINIPFWTTSEPETVHEQVINSLRDVL